MNKVLTINLNGRAYQLDEAGYELLRKYLDQAAVKLGNNPDKEEIMADFEQAIADKCDKFLNPNKTVVGTEEIKKVIEEMGPVDSEDGTKEDQKAENETDNKTPKHLYQIREGAMISGVCTGLAAYFNIDVTLIRLVFVVLTVLTGGVWILVYFVMALIIPYANTSEEQAAARGIPFNAQELIQRAREKYAKFDREYFESKKKYWKEHKDEWKAQHEAHIKSQKDRWKQWAYEQKDQWRKEWSKNPAAFSRFGRSPVVGIGAAFLGLFMTLVSLLWIVSIISLLTTGALFGIILAGIPLWLSVILLTCAYNILLLPLRSIKSAMNPHHPYGPYYDPNGWFGILDAIMWFTILGLLGWLLWTYVPQTHLLWDKSVSIFQQTTNQLMHPNQIPSTQQISSTQQSMLSQQAVQK